MKPAELIKRCSTDFAFYLDHLHAPTSTGAKPIGEIAFDLQRADFAVLGIAVMALARGETPVWRRFWLERTKGGSKDTDIAIAALWLLAFSPIFRRIQIGAYDSDQASEVRMILSQILGIDAPLNRLLAGRIKVCKSEITNPNTGSVCEILTTDSKGSHGSRPDLVLVNELSHVGNREFAETLLDNADKVPHSVVICATNAGFIGSWQQDWRNIAEDSPRWHFSVLNRPAPHISEEDLKESAKRNPGARYHRLWHGVWVKDTGDALSEADIRGCITRAGPLAIQMPEIPVMLGSLDLGVKHDRSAFVVTGCLPQQQRLRLASIQSWRPADYGGKVSLTEVRLDIIHTCRRLGVFDVVYDPSQAFLLAEDLTAAGINCIEYSPSVPANLNAMALSLLQVFHAKQIDIWEDPELIADLRRLSIVEGLTGQYKLKATKDDSGHADMAVALAQSLPLCLEVLQHWTDEPQQLEYSYAELN